MIRIGVLNDRSGPYADLSGEGSATVGNETVTVRAGDAVPIQLNEPHVFANTFGQPLEFLIVGVSRDNTRRVDTMNVQDIHVSRN